MRWQRKFKNHFLKTKPFFRWAVRSELPVLFACSEMIELSEKLVGYHQS
jgi:hypothetical protein